ncbi:MAG TPA: SDR family oxidoreductase [Actinomycetes bacterium]|nr:SDR family oxidoreductase [Actinomycetes bacterium]
MATEGGPEAGRDQSMRGRICLVTGATSGIGAVTAEELAGRGATVVMIGRSAERTAATVDRIRRRTGSSTVEHLLADLSAQRDVRQLADQFTARHDRLHVLVNNAGAVFIRRHLSPDGLELTFALNHLAYFLLTNLLLDRLKASAPARIVNVSSDAHQRARIDFDDLQAERSYSVAVYGRSKLANLLFTYELARRLQGTGVTVNALHPGVVATRFGTNNGRVIRLLHPLLRPFLISPEQGARTVVHLATSSEVEGVTGSYFVKERPSSSSRASYDTAAAERLWRVSEEMTGLRVPSPDEDR